MAAAMSTGLEAEILAREPFSLTEDEFKDFMVGLVVAKAQAVGEDALSAEDFREHFMLGKDVPASKEQFEAMLGKIKELSDTEFKEGMEFMKAQIKAETETVDASEVDASEPCPPLSEERIQDCIGKMKNGVLRMGDCGGLNYFGEPAKDIDAILPEIAARCEDLTFIDLSFSLVSDKGLKALHDCKNLVCIHMNMNKVSDTAVAELVRAHSGQLTDIVLTGVEPPVTAKTMIELVDTCKKLDFFAWDDSRCDTSDKVDALDAFKKAGFKMLENDGSSSSRWQKSTTSCSVM